MAAFLICTGVSKSGSPAVNETTSTPCLARSLARLARATVAAGLSFETRCEIFMITKRIHPRPVFTGCDAPYAAKHDI
jgi:hypothetical protein